MCEKEDRQECLSYLRCVRGARSEDRQECLSHLAAAAVEVDEMYQWRLF
jgi:hypothetical protein